jgi:hypothetical protein
MILFDTLSKIFINFAVNCDTTDNSILGLPLWHNNIPKQLDDNGVSCSVNIENMNAIWQIIGNLINFMLGIGVYVAIGFIIFGGSKIMMSQGSPDQIKEGKQTIINACIGLAICLASTAIVSAALGTSFK